MFAFMLPMALANAPALLAQNTAKVHKLVIQVSREDTEGFNLALGNATNPMDRASPCSAKTSLP